MAKSAFAMRLPATLSEDQLGKIRAYGVQSCDEHRIIVNPMGTFFGGVLRRPFATKKAAQNSFNLNLKNWGIEKNTWLRGWFRELTVEEYMNEFRDAPGVVGKKMQKVVQEILEKANKVALSHLAKAVVEQEKTEKENLKRERDAMQNASIESRRAAHYALDPKGNDEKARVMREFSALGMEDRSAQRIRHAESLPPPKKPRTHILDCPRPRRYIGEGL